MKIYVAQSTKQNFCQTVVSQFKEIITNIAGKLMTKTIRAHLSIQQPGFCFGDCEGFNQQIMKKKNFNALSVKVKFRHPITKHGRQRQQKLERLR